MEKKEKILIGKERENKSNFASQNGPQMALPSPSARPAKHPTSHLVLLGENHSGRDEMNLAGHPFALLQSPKRQSETSIFYDWPRTLPDGRTVTASWRVETPAVYGLPGPEEELLYLVLLQLTREAAEKAGTPREWPLIVTFSRFDVLRRMGWTDSAPRYAALSMAFARLNSVSITAKHAFFDARTRAPMAEVGFSILNEYSLSDETRGRKAQSHLPLSHFEWNTTLHTSFLAGNVRSLALDFAISLEHPTTRRLFRLLEMLRHAQKPPRPSIQIGLEKLRYRLGMAPYRFPSKIKEKLVGAHQELLQRGYLAEVIYETSREGELMALYRFGNADVASYGPQPSASPNMASMAPLTAFPETTAAALSSDSTESPQDFARRMHAVFLALPEPEQALLREQARRGVEPIFWDRLEAPDSPMSLGLWELVQTVATV